MATATQDRTTASGIAVPRGQVSDDLVAKYMDIYDPKDGWLAKYNVERDEEIELLGIALASGVDPLFLGDPGVGKTWMIELQLRTIRGASAEEMFNIMLFKEMSADEVLGPRAIQAYKEGRIERIFDGFLPQARIAYLDEFFKASPPLINALLDVMANRWVKVGGKIHKLPLLVMYGSSNELPDREDLNPARDRWGITKLVKPVRTPEGRKEVMGIQDIFQAGGRTLDLDDMPTLSLDEIDQIRAEVASVELPMAVREVIAEAEDKWEQAGHLPSQRRMGQIQMAAKARAWTRGRGEVTSDDLVVAQHMAWNHPDHAESARKIIMEFANQFTKRASRMREALEPILTELAEIKKELQAVGAVAPPDELLERAFKVKRDLRRMTKEAKKEIADGQAQAQDVSEVEKVEAEILRAHEWVEKAMLDDDPDA